MQFQYSLECWQHLRELHDAVQKVQSLRSRLQEKINRATGGRHDSLKVLDRLAVTVTGIDALEEVDVVYSGVSRVRPGDASLSSLANSFNYLMALMQSADVAPTEAQIQSLAEQRDVTSLVMTKLERIVSDIQKEF